MPISTITTELHPSGALTITEMWNVPGPKPRHGHKITLGRSEVDDLRRKLGVSDKLPPRAANWSAVMKYLTEER